MQLDNIPKSEQKGVLESFWLMLGLLESKASSSLERMTVEQLYQQWNRITGDSKKPEWPIESKQKTWSHADDVAAWNASERSRPRRV